jgi:hypothetical protein
VIAFDSAHADLRGAGSGQMLGYLAIFGASIAGYAGLSVFAVGIAASALLLLALAERVKLFSCARDAQVFQDMEQTIIGLVLNAIGATGLAYVAGYSVFSLASG